MSEKIKITSAIYLPNESKNINNYLYIDNESSKNFKYIKNDTNRFNNATTTSFFYKKEQVNNRYSRSFFADDIPNLLKKYSVP